MADFRYFRNGATYYRADPDKPEGQRVRRSAQGLWISCTFDTVTDLMLGSHAVEIPVDEVPCHLCMVVAGTVPREVVYEWPDALAVVPRPEPCEPHHRLIIPKRHVRDALEDQALTTRMFARATEFAALRGAPLNIATSVGKDATQTEPHLHIHVGLLPLAWGQGGVSRG